MSTIQYDQLSRCQGTIGGYPSGIGRYVKMPDDMIELRVEYTGLKAEPNMPVDFSLAASSRKWISMSVIKYMLKYDYYVKPNLFQAWTSYLLPVL